MEKRNIKQWIRHKVGVTPTGVYYDDLGRITLIKFNVALGSKHVKELERIVKEERVNLKQPNLFRELDTVQIITRDKKGNQYIGEIDVGEGSV